MKSENPLLKWSTWTIMQTIPSVTFFEDKDDVNNGLRTGFEWQIIPLSYSFSANPYISNIGLFYIRPVKRFSGSVELYFQPEYIFGGFRYSSIKRFMFKSGIRIVFPVAQKGEYLSLSVGTGLNYQRLSAGGLKNTPTIETAVYSFFGMLGLKFNYNPNAISKYSFGLYIKYY
jgi:hypothetical protein